VITYRDPENRTLGVDVVPYEVYQRKYQPAQIAWAKRHNLPGFAIGKSRAAPATDPEKDAGIGGAGASPPGGAGSATTDKPEVNGDVSRGPGGANAPGGGDGSDNTAANGAGTGTGADAGDGSGITGSNKPGAIDQGDGVGTTPGSARTGSGAGAGKGSAPPGGSPSGKDASGTGGGDAGPVRQGHRRSGGGAGSEFGEVGGRADGVLGGTPFSPGGSIDALGNPLMPNSTANGSDQDGQTTQSKRQQGHGAGDKGGDARNGGNAGGGGVRKSGGRGSPTVSNSRPCCNWRIFGGTQASRLTRQRSC
jgi:hypothetical protein